MAKSLPTNNGQFGITHTKIQLNNAGNAERLHMSAQGHRRKSTQTSENGQGRLHEKEELNLQDLDKVESRKNAMEEQWHITIFNL